MSPATLRFQDLVPERDEFDLGDGRKIFFRSRAEFDAADLARFRALDRRQRAIRERMNGEDASDDTVVAADEFDRLLRELIQIILPDLTAEEMTRLHLRQLSEIMTWWSERQHDPKSAAGAEAGT